MPKGDLPPADTVAATTNSPASATPFTAGSDTTTAGLSVTLRDNGKQFASGSDKLTPEAESLFKEVADQYSYTRQQARLSAASTEDDKAAVEALKTKRILLVGHTDDCGSTTENANLSERRAAAVARVFQAQGVAAANLYFQGAGETLPVADNHTEAGRAANRRVEIVDLTDDAAFHKFLASRRQTLAYYRASDVTVPDVAAVAPVKPRARRRPRPTRASSTSAACPRPRSPARPTSRPAPSAAAPRPAAARSVPSCPPATPTARARPTA